MYAAGKLMIGYDKKGILLSVMSILHLIKTRENVLTYLTYCC